MNGIVSLNLTKDFITQNVNENKLYVKIKGKEYYSYLKGNTKRSKKMASTIRRKAKFYAHKFLVYEWQNGFIKGGQY